MFLVRICLKLISLILIIIEYEYINLLFINLFVFSDILY